MSSEQISQNKSTLESSAATQKSQDNPMPNSILLTQRDIDTICEICEIAWRKYFSKPLPGYNGMKVYWKGKVQLFHLLNREDQIEIIQLAHISNITPHIIAKQKVSSSTEFEKFIDEFIGFNEGNLLSYHGIAHSVRTAIIGQILSQQYVKNFKEYQNMTPRTVFCSLSASLLHDIGRCFGGDMYDVFGSLSAEIAGEILNEVGCFSDEEINWIKEAIDVGGLNINDVKNFSAENGDILNERQLIACIMGDADSFEFERFYELHKLCCDIKYTSIKKLGLLTKDGEYPDEILNDLKMVARSLAGKLSEPEINTNQIDHIKFLRNELTKLNEKNQE